MHVSFENEVVPQRHVTFENSPRSNSQTDLNAEQHEKEEMKRLSAAIMSNLINIDAKNRNHVSPYKSSPFLDDENNLESMIHMIKESTEELKHVHDIKNQALI
jgi:hypothetical protein